MKNFDSDIEKTNSDIEKIKEDAATWSDMCLIKDIGYGIFFFEKDDCVTGGANLSTTEISIVLERISKSLSHKEIRLLIELLKKVSCQERE